MLVGGGGGGGGSDNAQKAFKEEKIDRSERVPPVGVRNGQKKTDYY